jgi:hypothetical protein
LEQTSQEGAKKMDLEINVDILKVGEISKALGFKDIYIEDDVIEAKLKDGTLWAVHTLSLRRLLGATILSYFMVWLLRL